MSLQFPVYMHYVDDSGQLLNNPSDSRTRATEQNEHRDCRTWRRVQRVATMINRPIHHCENWRVEFHYCIHHHYHLPLQQWQHV